MSPAVNLIPVSALPKIGWAGGRPLELARFKPVGPVPIDINPVNTKPAGGLWTAPVTRAGLHAQIVGTYWTLNEMPFTLVKPYRNTRVMMIDNPADLDAAITRWPDKRPLPHARDFGDLVSPAGYTRDAYGRLRKGGPPALRIDWPAMAADVDAVYVTRAALEDLNLPHDNGGRNLRGWDVPTVLFLNPAFSPGRTIEPPPPDVILALARSKIRHQLNTAVQRKQITQLKADQIWIALTEGAR